VIHALTSIEVGVKTRMQMARVTKNEAAPNTQLACRSRKVWTLHTMSGALESKLRNPRFSPLSTPPQGVRVVE